MSRILDQYGNPVPRAARRKYKPAEVTVRCASCGTEYVRKERADGPRMEQGCRCQVQPEHLGVPTFRDMVGTMPAWLEGS